MSSHTLNFGSYIGKEYSIKEKLKINLRQLCVLSSQTLDNFDSQEEILKEMNKLFEENRQTKEIKGDFINFIEEDIKTFSQNLKRFHWIFDEMKGFDEKVMNDELLKYKVEEN